MTKRTTTVLMQITYACKQLNAIGNQRNNANAKNHILTLYFCKSQLMLFQHLLPSLPYGVR
jgi:hypothetical protein